MNDDAADVRRVLAGDVDAYTKLVDRYYDRCARFAIRMLGNRDDAEDALQATFLRAYRALGKYQEQDKFSAWLYRILTNQCRSIAVRRAHRERVFVHEDALLLNAADTRPNWSGEDEEFVQRVLNELDPLLREAFLLKYVDELSYEEMAVLTGAGISALKMRVKRACERLRERWDRIKDD
jgi:RNA polymerase sigma-70 factor (ECF subfamily)